MTTTATTDPTRETTHAVLVSHLADLHDGGNPVPCLTYPHGGWTTEDEDEARLVAKLCRTCPALSACRDYITAWPEPSGVWAGTTERDRRPRQGRPRKETAA